MIELIKQMPDKVLDCIYTDIPYFIVEEERKN